MAGTASSDVGPGTQGTVSAIDQIKDTGLSFLNGLAGLGLKWGESKLIDVETSNSDYNIPDRNDLANGTAAQAAGDAFGGTYSTPPSEWLKYGAFALAGVALLVVVKKAL